MDYTEQANIVDSAINNLMRNPDGIIGTHMMSKKEQEKMAQSYFESTGNHIEFLSGHDMFDFECQRCGRCCMGRQDIVMNPLDIYHIAKATGKTPKEVIKENMVVNIGPSSGLPILCLKTDDRGWCPYLEMDMSVGGLFKCSIDKYKPGACRNHPIGITMGFEKKDDGSRIDENYKYQEDYIIVDQCDNSRGHNHMNRVDDWVANTESTPEERKMAHLLQLGPSFIFDSIKFYTMVFNTIIMLRILETDQTDEIKKNMNTVKKEFVDAIKEGDGTYAGTINVYIKSIVNLMDTYIHKMYVDYDMSKDFAPQALANWKHIEKVMDETKIKYDKLYNFLRNDVGIMDDAIFYIAENIGKEGIFQAVISMKNFIKVLEKEDKENAMES